MSNDVALGSVEQQTVAVIQPGLDNTAGKLRQQTSRHLDRMCLQRANSKITDDDNVSHVTVK
jgi:hypothetical protein